MRLDVPILLRTLQLSWLVGLLFQVMATALPAQEVIGELEVRRLPTVDVPAEAAWLKPVDELPEQVEEKAWTGDLELGLNGSEGNSISFNLYAGVDLDFQTPGGVLDIEFDYSKVTSDSVQIRHQALLDLEHRWLTTTPLSCFVQFGFDYDEFKSFDSRISTNGGAEYDFIKTDLTRLAGRFGAGFSRELGGPVNAMVPEALFGLNIKRQLTVRQHLEMAVEYLPDWSDFHKFRLETDAGWKITLDEEKNLSLKFELNDRYDNTPIGLRPNDLTYAALLAWKL